MKKLSLLLTVLFFGCSRTSFEETSLTTTKIDLEKISHINNKHFIWHQQSDGGSYLTHASALRYINKVGKRLVHVLDSPNASYEFCIIKNMIPHAIAFLNGKIAINLGLLFLIENEAELAAVIAQNIACSKLLFHKIQEKGFQSYWVSEEMLQQSFLNDFQYPALSLNEETDLDQFAYEALIRAGYDPHAILTLHIKLAGSKHQSPSHKGLNVHPYSEKRIAFANNLLSNYINGGYIGKSTYQDALKPLLRGKKAYSLYHLAQEYLAEKKGLQALEIINQMLELEPKEAKFYLLRGKAFALSNQLELALQSFNESLKLDSNYYQAYLERGRLYYAKGDFEKATIDFQQSIHHFPYAASYYYLGESLLKIGKKGDAIRSLSTIVDSNTIYASKAMLLLQEMR